jgi:hypothetical protein
MLEFFERDARHGLSRAHTVNTPNDSLRREVSPPCTGTIQTSGYSVMAGRLLSTTHANAHRHHERPPFATSVNVSAEGRWQPDRIPFRGITTRLPVRQSRPTTRPQTHQNLIHTNKEQNSAKHRPGHTSAWPKRTLDWSRQRTTNRPPVGDGRALARYLGNFSTVAGRQSSAFSRQGKPGEQRSSNLFLPTTDD